MRRRRRALIGALAAHTLLVGCYAHVPAAPGSVLPGARVRVALSDEGVRALASSLGASVRGLDGQVERVAGDTLVLRPDRLLTTADVDVAWSGDALALPPAWRQAVERRQLSRSRTAVLVAGGVALVVATLAVLRAAGDGRGGPGGGNPTPF